MKPVMKTSDRIVAIIVAAAIILLAIASFFMHRTAGTRAVVRVNGDIVLTVDLTDSTAQDFHVNGVIGVVDLHTDGKGAIRVTRATCPDQICVHTTPAHSPGDQIICVPNHLTVTVEGGKKHVDVLAQ